LYFRPELLSLLIVLFFLLFWLILMGRPLQKNPALRRFKSDRDRDEIWQYCSSSIDGVGVSICSHTFKMTAMTSFTQKLAAAWSVNANRVLGGYATSSTVPDVQYLIL